MACGGGGGCIPHPPPLDPPLVAAALNLLKLKIYLNALPLKMKDNELQYFSNDFKAHVLILTLWKYNANWQLLGLAFHQTAGIQRPA